MFSEHPYKFMEKMLTENVGLSERKNKMMNSNDENSFRINTDNKVFNI